MKSFIKSVPLIGLFVWLIGCKESTTTSSFDREKAREEFKDMLIDYGIAIERGIADTTINFFAESPDFFLYSDGKKYTLDVLKKEIREEWHNDKSTRRLEIKWNEMDVTVLSETSAVCFAKVDEFETDTDESRSHPLKIAVDVTFAGVKTNNRWKIVYGHAVHKVVFDSTKVSSQK